MTHAGLVRKAEQWLRGYRCGIVLSEQACCSGEMPDAIGWKGKCQSVVIECKISRADFLADRNKPWRQNSDIALGSERFFLAPRGIIGTSELPAGWGLLEIVKPHPFAPKSGARRMGHTPKNGTRRMGHGGYEIQVAVKSKKNMRSQTGLMYEMNLLLASLRRVEVRIEPQSITDFLKWKNRMAEYNGGAMPSGILAPEDEDNVHLEVDSGLKSLV